MKLMRYILAMSIAVIAAFGSGLQARAQPQTQSDDAILRLSGTSTAPLKTLRTGSLTIVDQDQVFIDTEGVQWTEGQLDGRAAVVGIVGERDGPESRYTIEVVDPVARIIRIQQRGRYISRMSYWSAFPQHKLSYYTYTDGPPNGYGNFKVTDAGNGRMTLQEDGVFVSRFCCVPGGPRDQNAVVASFENRASSGPPVRFRLIGRASSVVQSPAPQPQSPKILPQTAAPGSVNWPDPGGPANYHVGSPLPWTVKAVLGIRLMDFDFDLCSCRAKVHDVAVIGAGPSTVLASDHPRARRTSASCAQMLDLCRCAPWMLKQVQHDEFGWYRSAL